MAKAGYRADIDGLRAVAVLLVVMFHADLGFPGGYVGVDVFFVISGYLITGVILRAQEEDSFSLARFWDRRLRRIVPAASVMTATVVVCGLPVLFSRDLVALGESALAHQAIASNIYFWRTSGYFGGDSALKPLLHCWSLAVEEQFYLGYPLLLLITRRMARRVVWVILLLLGIASLAASEWGLQGHPTAAFYLLPPRAWEMLLGASLAFGERPKLRSSVAQGVSLAGLALILIPGLCYDEQTRFPGAAAVWPCLGAAMVIFGNSSGQTVVMRALSFRPLVGIGLISYSLYLWHWPVLAFSRYWLGYLLPWGIRLAAIPLSLGLAYASWRFVETPLREPRGHHSLRWSLIGALASAAMISGVSAWIMVQSGDMGLAPQRLLRYEGQPFPTQFEATRAAFSPTPQLPTLGAATAPGERPDFVVWGDSHAVTFGPVFDRLAREQGLAGTMAARHGTLPLLGMFRTSLPHRKGVDLEWNNMVMRWVEASQPRHVVFIARWAGYVEESRPLDRKMLSVDEQAQVFDRGSALASMRRGIRRTLMRLDNLDIKVWILAQVPLQRTDPRKSLVIADFLGRALPGGVTHAEHRARQQGVMSAWNAARKNGVALVGVDEKFFDAKGVSRLGDARGTFYRDDDHASEHGISVLVEEYLATHLIPMLGR